MKLAPRSVQVEDGDEEGTLGLSISSDTNNGPTVTLIRPDHGC
jgi:hypothetical protein